jgi:hypothetical protein
MPKKACLVRVPRYDDATRTGLAADGIFETFRTTSPEPDAIGPAYVRLTVPAATEPDADARLIRALKGTGDRVSGWDWLPADWKG